MRVLLTALVSVYMLSLGAGFAHAQSPREFRNPGQIEFAVVHGNPDYVSLPPQERRLALGSGPIHSNIASFLITYKGSALMGEYIYSAGFWWELNPELLVGRTRTVNFREISKYPDLVRRYNAIKPESVEIVLRAAIVTRDTAFHNVAFRVKDNDLVYFGSRSSENYIVPTSPMRWKDAISTVVLAPFINPDNSDEVELKRIVTDAVAFVDTHPSSLFITWPEDAIDEIARLYDKYEEEEKAIDDEYDAVTEDLRPSQNVQPFSGDPELARPYEEPFPTGELTRDERGLVIRSESNFEFRPVGYRGGDALSGNRFFKLEATDGHHVVTAKGRRMEAKGASTFVSVLDSTALARLRQQQPETFAEVHPGAEIHPGTSAVLISGPLVYTARDVGYTWFNERFLSQSEFDARVGRHETRRAPQAPATRSHNPNAVTIRLGSYDVGVRRGTLVIVDERFREISSHTVYYSTAPVRR